VAKKRQRIEQKAVIVCSRTDSMLAFITLEFVIPKANQMQRSLSKHLHDKWIFLYENEMIQKKNGQNPTRAGSEILGTESQTKQLVNGLA
jgi:hypothetical protein